MKDIKVTITVSPTDEELDQNKLRWLSVFSENSESYIKHQIKQALVESILPGLIDEYQDIKPTREEIKAAIIDKMAERALDND